MLSSKRRIIFHLLNIIYCDELISDEELTTMLAKTADMFAAYNDGNVEWSGIIRA